MADAMICLLGPQRFDPNVAPVLDELGAKGPVAVVTAGWQEREDEDLELQDHLARPIVNLRLYRRADEVYREDPGLFDLLRARQNRLRALQEIYRLRLNPLMEVARKLRSRKGDPGLLDPEREDAVESVRRLDRHHLARLTQAHREFENRYRPSARPAVARQREQLAGLLREAGVLAIAGGHVAVLLNRLRLFDLFGLRDDLPVVAWSAGAMALSERVVLFHDSPPQGAGNAELLDAGLARFRGAVVLPHAGRRLRLDDPARVSILARRFRPDRCVALDPGSGYCPGKGRAGRFLEGTLQLYEDGSVRQGETR